MSEAHFIMASDDLAGDAKRRVPIPKISMLTCYDIRLLLPHGISY